MIEQASLVIGEGNWAVKSDSLLGYKINGGKYYPREMSVVRSTTGTRINEDGLVELVPYNLLTYSEQFDNVAWTKFNATVTANTAVAPDGNTTADTITSNASSGGDVYLSINISGVHTLSAYFKEGTTNICRLGSTVGGFADFNLTNQTYTLNSGISASITSVGNGWNRCTLTVDITSTTLIYLSSKDISTKTVYAWGAQLVEGSSALDYLPTTDRLDVARIDYSSGSGALLVEPQRTNLLLYSQDISNAAWTKSSGGTGSTPIVTANYTASPLEGKMADRVIFNLNGGTSSADLSTLQSSSFNLTLGDNVTYYMAVKTNDGSTVNMTLNNNLGLAEVKSITPEWTIIKTSTTATATSSGVLRLRLRGSEAVSDYADISVAYAQLEVGSYATSYIPTQSATVTRNADVISKTGISSLINSEEGVLYAEIKGFISQDTIEPNRYITLTNGTSNERVSLLLGGNLNQLRAIIYSSTQSMNLSFTTSLTDVKQYNKLAVKYKSGDYAFFLNGVKIGGSIITNAFPANTLTKLSFDIGDGTQQFRGYAKGVIVYNTALTDAELATLTTI